jgi:hypothetical protein
MADTASTGTGTYAPANYIGLTENTGTPVATDTALAAELTTGTLARAQAAFAHTTGVASYTLTKTFTSDATKTIAKIAVFNASTGGTMVFESLLPTPASLQSGDQIAITESVTV